MKKVLIITALAFIVLFNACKDDDGDDKSSKTELLCGQDWKISSSTIDPVISFAGTVVMDDLSKAMDDCDMDETYTFNTDGTVAYDAGVICDEDDEDEDGSGTWAFNASETEITITFDDEAQVWKIDELSTSKFATSISFNMTEVTDMMDLSELEGLPFFDLSLLELADEYSIKTVMVPAN